MSLTSVQHSRGMPLEPVDEVSYCMGVAVISFAVAGFALLLLLDAGVRLDDAKSEVARQRERADQVLFITRDDWVGRREEAVSLLAKRMKDEGRVVKLDGKSVEVGDVRFSVEGGVVVKVSYID